VRLTPATFTACPVVGTDAASIRKELAEIATEGLAAILGVDQIEAINREFASVVGDSQVFDWEG
jgi:hypothetical protein